MNWKFILFLIVLGAITFVGGYQHEILNYHNNDASTWTLRVAVIVLCVFGISINIIRFVASRKGIPIAITLFMIMISWIGAIIAGNKINAIHSAETKTQADEIIRASYNYYADHNKFPESLKDLKPKYIKEIPLSALGNASDEYEYYSSREHFSITYEDIKSKAMRYDSDKKTWQVLDRSFE